MIITKDTLLFSFLYLSGGHDECHIIRYEMRISLAKVMKLLK
jgi:hypothetical protein